MGAGRARGGGLGDGGGRGRARGHASFFGKTLKEMSASHGLDWGTGRGVELVGFLVRRFWAIEVEANRGLEEFFS